MEFKRKFWQLIALQAFIFLLLPQTIPARIPQTTGSDGSWTEIIRRAMPGVVSIVLYNANGEQISSGSGFVVRSDGIVVTNYHVIQSARLAQVITKQGEKFEVKGVVSFDPIKDFAILKIPAFDLPVVTLGNSNNTEIGESVLAIGDPRGLTGTVSSGIISAQRRELEGSTWIQTTAPISPGNSGGPLLNGRGEVIGVISMQRTDGQNLNFAVPINYVRGDLQLGTAIKYSLAQLAEVEKERAEQEAKEIIRKALIKYEDPNGIFNLQVLRNWRVERNQNRHDSSGVIQIGTMLAPPGAVLAEVDGYLSEGIRVVVLLASSGHHFKDETIETWKNEFPEDILKSNPGFALTSSDKSQVNDIPAKVYTFVGQSQKLSEPEKTLFYVFGNQKVLVRIEIVTPTNKLKLLELLNLLVRTFELKIK